MPKTVKVSISAIVKDVDVALKQLTKGKALAQNAQEKNAISARIKKLHRAKRELTLACRTKSMTVSVPGA